MLKPEDGLYTKTCKDCGCVFRADKKNTNRCPECKTHKTAVKKSKPTSGAEFISIRKMVEIIDRYNREHRTSYTYGQFVHLLGCGKIEPL